MKNLRQADIIKIIELTLGKQPVHLDDLLIEDLGAESTDIANIVVNLENKFEIRIPESTLPTLKSPADFYNLVRDSLSSNTD